MHNSRHTRMHLASEQRHVLEARDWPKAADGPMRGAYMEGFRMRAWSCASCANTVQLQACRVGGQDHG